MLYIIPHIEVLAKENNEWGQIVTIECIALLSEHVDDGDMILPSPLDSLPSVLLGITPIIMKHDQSPIPPTVYYALDQPTLEPRRWHKIIKAPFPWAEQCRTFEISMRPMIDMYLYNGQTADLCRWTTLLEVDPGTRALKRMKASPTARPDMGVDYSGRPQQRR